MKILTIQERGRHKKNEKFREALNFQRAFYRLNIPCTVWGLNYDNFNTPFEEIEKDHDVILLLENYENGFWLPNISDSKKLKVFWSIDSHWNLNAHLKTCDIHNIDILLNSTSTYIKHFEKPGRKCYYFPNSYPEDLIKPMDVLKKTDVGFCGNTINRAQWIWTLQDRVNLKYDKFVIGSNMVNAINSYKIHWNRCIHDDTNYRVFETLGCRTFLLTNKTPDLEKLFTIGQHLITYENLQDCINKIEYYLKNDKEREEIAKHGYNTVKEKHTYDNRAKELLEIL